MKQVDVIADYAGRQMAVASVSTTKQMFVIRLSDGRQEHYTYPPDGHFHLTPHDQSSARSSCAKGPTYDALSYHPLMSVPVPSTASALTRPYRASSALSMTVQPGGVLEIGILGQHATAAMMQSLGGGGKVVEQFPGPRSDTTLVLRYSGNS